MSEETLEFVLAEDMRLLDEALIHIDRLLALSSKVEHDVHYREGSIVGQFEGKVDAWKITRRLALAT